MIQTDNVILVTGASGMVGSALVRLLKNKGFSRILAPSRKELDLMSQTGVDHYFAQHLPEYVFMIAAKVGGIAANQSDPAGFLAENLRIQLNLFESCLKYRPKKCLFLGSSCIYPRECPQPMKEEYLMTGPLEPTNEGYALAKITGLKLAAYYYQQYQLLTICPLPCNIYGTNDHFELSQSHVLSALVRRFVDAKEECIQQVTLWGTGNARREFIHVDDVVEALLFLMEYKNDPAIINVGTGNDIAIRNLAEMIAEYVNYTGKIFWDTNKPDGMPRKCLDITHLNNLGFQSSINFEDGVKQAIAEYYNFRSVSKK